MPGQLQSRNDPEISGSFPTCPAPDKFEMIPRSRTYKSCSTNARTAAREQEHELAPALMLLFFFFKIDNH